MLSSNFSGFLWDGRSQRGRRIWEGAAQTLAEKRLEACVLGERNADGERRAKETPTATLQDGRGSRAAVTAAHQYFPRSNRVSLLSHCRNILPVTVRRKSGAPLAAYSTIP